MENVHIVSYLDDEEWSVGHQSIASSASSSSRSGEELQTLKDTALHIAVERQDTATIAELMRKGASPAALGHSGLTPVHLCIVNKCIEPFTILLSYEGSSNVLDASGLSVLQVAVLHIWREGVTAALKAGAQVTATELAFVSEDVLRQRYPKVTLSLFGSKFHEDTVIHLVAKCGDIDIIDNVMSFIEHTTIKNSFNKRGVTPLYSAIESGNLEAVKILIHRGTSLNQVSNRNDTALHIAVRHPHILKYLLENTDVKNFKNDKISAPIHIAVAINKLQSVKILLENEQKKNEFRPPKSTFSFKKYIQNKIFAKNNFVAIPRSRSVIPTCSSLSRVYRFQEVACQVTSLDGEGFSPLHIAAKQRNMSMITLLLQKGAKLSTIGAKGRSALEIIATEFYNPSKCFELIFDNFINTKQVADDIVVTVNYDALTKIRGVTQVKVIEDLVKCGQRKTLVHPLIESLLHLKWKHLLPAFYATIGIYTTFLVAFNFFVVNIIHHRDKIDRSFHTSTTNNTGVAWFELFDECYWFLVTLIYTSILLLTLQELFYMYLRRFRYFLTLESWVKMTSLALGSIVPVIESAVEQPYWHRHAASFALLLTWLQAMFLVSRFPKWGYYVLIFGKVTINIFKILLTSICLIIGFSFCFMIEYQSAPPFDDPFAAFVKTLVMMVSEFDYEALFGKEHENDLQDTKTVIRLVFVIFVIFVAIILMNFMIAVAVSDINDLQMAGSIKMLEKQVELLGSLEILVNSPLLANLYNKRFGDKTYHSKISNYVGYQSKWRVSVSDDEFYNLDLPAALHAAIIEIAWKKEQRDEKNSVFNENKYKLNALYNAVVGRPVDMDEVNEEEQRSEKKQSPEEQSKLNEEIKLLTGNLSAVNSDVKKALTTINQLTSDISTIKEMLTRLAFEKRSENIGVVV